MIEQLKAYYRENTTLTEGDLERICSLATPRVLQRNELLLQQGQVCRLKIFVVKGLLRLYGITEDGSERILQFSPEHSWTTESESYFKQTPSVYNIAAVEKSEVITWTHADFEQLMADIPELTGLGQRLVAQVAQSGRQRIYTMLSATPEEMYDEFIRAYPDLPARLPLHMIAGYLGISVKTLTRIRHAQLHR